MEEKLSVQVWLLNGVYVCNCDSSILLTAKDNHGKVLEQLTANGTSTYLEVDKPSDQSE